MYTDEFLEYCSNLSCAGVPTDSVIYPSGDHISVKFKIGQYTISSTYSWSLNKSFNCAGPLYVDFFNKYSWLCTSVGITSVAGMRMRGANYILYIIVLCDFTEGT